MNVASSNFAQSASTAYSVASTRSSEAVNVAAPSSRCAKVAVIVLSPAFNVIVLPSKSSAVTSESSGNVTVTALWFDLLTA